MLVDRGGEERKGEWESVREREADICRDRKRENEREIIARRQGSGTLQVRLCLD